MGENRKVTESSPIEEEFGTHVWAYFSLWSADSHGRALSNSKVSIHPSRCRSILQRQQ